MKEKLIFFIEAYFYEASISQKIISYLLLPFSALYCLIVFLRFKSLKPKDFSIAIISVGNLNVGGSGKTPLISELSNHYEDVAIILRGYGRKSRGLVVVKDKEKICSNVYESGDEAMIYALKVPNAIVIVSENREDGIIKAKELGAKIIFLDDAYRHHQIKKLDILIDVKTPNNFCLPAGAFREKLWSGKEAVVIKEEIDFVRKSTIINQSEKMVLITAIARPQRLDKFLPKNVVSKHYFADHHYFNKDELENILLQSGAQSILCTYKDYVKIREFNLPISLLELELEIDKSLYKKIDEYIKECR